MINPAGRRRSARKQTRHDAPEARMGRPPDPQIEAEVGAAVSILLRTRGYHGVTIERVAKRIKRARTSLYRRWPSKRHLVAFAVVSQMGRDPAPDTGSLKKDLEAVVRNLSTALAGPIGQSLGGLVADMAQDAGLADLIRVEVIGRRRVSMRAAFARGLARGEIRGSLNIEVMLDMLTGPFYFRRLFGHQAISKRLVREVVDYLLLAAAPLA